MAFQGNLDAAVALLQRALEIDETFYGSEHPDIIMDLDSLREVFDIQARILNDLHNITSHGDYFQ